MRFLQTSLFCALAIVQTALAKGPFLQKIGDEEHIIGNDIWNITIGRQYGTKLFYKNKDLVGDAWGHYVSYNGACCDLNWTSVAVHRQTKDYLDVIFSAKEGDFHWVIQPQLAGAYQYFINRALPVLGEFRSLFRLDNTTFPIGKTRIRDDPLPASAEYLAAMNVQDETWQKADGTFLTKYDWSDFIREQEYHGVYGKDFGSWYIVAGDDFNGDQLKQELLVHRESRTGDAVMLNMFHGTHYQALSRDPFEVGRTWGPWLWYLNDGSKSDASSRARSERKAYPYKWFSDAAYQSRGSVSGTLTLSDGRPASYAAIHLGDNNANISTLSQGKKQVYTTYADRRGSFTIEDVRTGDYALQAWSDGKDIADVSTVFKLNDIVVRKDKTAKLGKLNWQTQDRKKVWQIGELDRKALGFKYGGAPYQHGLVASCPANLTFVPGSSKTDEWCFGQSSLGTWTVKFPLAAKDLQNSQGKGAVLSVSLAGHSQGCESVIDVNGVRAGGLRAIPNDQSVYRSGTTAGEWYFFEFAIPEGTLTEGENLVGFQVTKSTKWRGWLWDAVVLEWAK